MTTKRKSKTINQLERILGNIFTFKDMLYSIRTTDGISQVALAEAVGISKAKLCDIEKGRRTPTLSQVVCFAEALDYPVQLFISQYLEDQLRENNLKFKVTLDAA